MPAVELTCNPSGKTTMWPTPRELAVESSSQSHFQRKDLVVALSIVAKMLIDVSMPFDVTRRADVAKALHVATSGGKAKPIIASLTIVVTLVRKGSTFALEFFVLRPPPMKSSIL